ncbi:hypothetical protein BD779DRAFT_1541356 [Infundibulicybe gibba]|nr:hypothetical protein BD779DRAFT_1541356 [Infundibulicybe gibba]
MLIAASPRKMARILASVESVLAGGWCVHPRFYCLTLISKHLRRLHSTNILSLDSVALTYLNNCGRRDLISILFPPGNPLH